MTLSLGTAYRSFGGEVEASSTPTICRLPDSRRHQLWAIAPRSPATCTGEHLKPMKRLSDSIIHCVHSKPNGYQNHQTRRSGHHQEGDLGTPLTVRSLS